MGSTATIFNKDGVSVRVTENKFPKIAANLGQTVDKYIRKAAFDIEALAKTQAPYLTGFLSGSVNAYKVETGWWRVAVGAEYGAHVEYGTRYMAAQPYLIPAFERTVPSLLRALQGLGPELVT